MGPKTLVTNIGQLVTVVEGEVRVTPDAALVCEGGHIVSAGPRGSVPSEAEQVADAEGGVVLPGFVDAHTHLVFAGHRADELGLRASGATYQEIARAGGGIMSTVLKTRAAKPDDLIRKHGMRHLSWCTRNGTTTLEAKSGYGLDRSTELDILFAVHHLDRALASASGFDTNRIRATFLGLHAVPPDCAAKEEYVDQMVDEVLPVVAEAGLADSVDAFVEEGYFSHGDARKLAAAAKRFGMGLRLHADQLSDGGGAALAAELRATTADHLEHASLEGIRAMKAAGVVPVLLPASVMGLGLSRYPDARAMIAEGLSVVLATDFNPGSSPTPSIPFVMALAARFMKMSPEECLAAVTVNAARCLGFSDRGALVPGQLADFSVWPVSDWREILCWIDGPRPASVWMAGTRVVG